LDLLKEIELGKVKKEQIVEQCNGCNKIMDDLTCEATLIPKSRWRLGNCNLASHIVVKETKVKPGYRPGKFGKKRRNR